MLTDNQRKDAIMLNMRVEIAIAADKESPKIDSPSNSISFALNCRHTVANIMLNSLIIKAINTFLQYLITIT